MTAPGTRLRALAARLCAPGTMERLVDPAIADLQAEYEEASRTGPWWRKRWIWMRGHLAFFTMIAMAFAIWSGIVGFEFYTQIMHPALPLDGGDRIVSIVMVDTASQGERAPTLHDFVAWRDALTSVQDLAAYRDRNWNVIAGDAAPEPVAVAEITAATFRVVRERPVLGRPLVEADERPDAPWVVVIGYDVWQSRFASDPNVIGRELRLGNVPQWMRRRRGFRTGDPGAGAARAPNPAARRAARRVMWEGFGMPADGLAARTAFVPVSEI